MQGDHNYGQLLCTIRSLYNKAAMQKVIRSIVEKWVRESSLRIAEKLADMDRDKVNSETSRGLGFPGHFCLYRLISGVRNVGLAN